ncbi:hypothetical protein [Catelliglobosispora koreensis]|uniref:hypothetical protein n=1 Tax=Catelliglobosispora koreensis TaxID=129052 RepID=UPI0003680406|nr:hypothetical protein [Catelliglobosispora koreensis]
MATIEDLLACIDDPDDDSTRAYELTASRDRSLTPRLVDELGSFIAAEHFYGRDVIADAIAEIEGVEALPVLIRASAVDIGDDQDSLGSTIMEAIWADIGRAAELVDELASDNDPRVRDKAQWARSMVDLQASRKA